MRTSKTDPDLNPPAAVARESPAFPLSSRVLATGLVAYAAFGGARFGWPTAQAGATPWLLLAGLAMLLWMLWWIWRSRTRFDGTTISQTWIWDKQVALAEASHAKVIAFPAMDWLVGPRLVLRLHTSGVVVFRAADRSLLAEVKLRVDQAQQES